MSPNEIAAEIIRQLGGARRLKAMIGADFFMFDKHGADVELSFQFKGSRKFNYCNIVYRYGLDLYDFRLGRVHLDPSTRMSVFTNQVDISEVYNDMLIDLFEKETGLLLHL